MKRMLLIVSLVLLLSGCGDKHPAAMPKKFQPVINPHPQYFMTVKGHIAPELVSKIKLKWQAVYSTTNSACDETYNKFEGVVGWRQIIKNFEATVDKQGDYEIKIPLDHYQLGFCQWKISMILDYSGIENHGSSVAQFYPCGKSASCELLDKSLPGSYITKSLSTNICRYDTKKQLLCQTNDNSYGFSDAQQIPRDDNYELIESYVFQNKQEKS